MGLLVAIGVIEVMWMIPAEDGAMEFLGRPLLSQSVIFVSVGLLTSIGLLAGLFPARKAANVNPVDALKV